VHFQITAHGSTTSLRASTPKPHSRSPPYPLQIYSSDRVWSGEGKGTLGRKITQLPARGWVCGERQHCHYWAEDTTGDSRASGCPALCWLLRVKSQKLSPTQPINWTNSTVTPQAASSAATRLQPASSLPRIQNTTVAEHPSPGWTPDGCGYPGRAPHNTHLATRVLLGLCSPELLAQENTQAVYRDSWEPRAGPAGAAAKPGGNAERGKGLKCWMWSARSQLLHTGYGRSEPTPPITEQRPFFKT